MSYILKLALVLALITGIAAGALSLTNQFTAGQIAEQVVRAKLEALEAVMPAAIRFDEQPELLAAAQAADARLRDLTELYLAVGAAGPVGVACGVSVPGYGGPINMMIGVSSEGRVTGVKIISATGETPGLGAKITEPGFLRQFVGKDTASPLVLIKGGQPGPGEVQSIAAATLSASAVLRGVNAAAAMFRETAGDGDDRLIAIKEDAALRLFAGADRVEADPDRLAQLKATHADLADVTDLYYVKAGDQLLGTAIAASGQGYGGPILSVTGFDGQGRIAGVAFVDMPGETVGLGTLITEQRFAGQFAGQSATVLRLTRAAPGPGEIQALSSATISCQGAVDAVNNAIKLFNRLDD